jgi:hypothetical protein
MLQDPDKVQVGKDVIPIKKEKPHRLKTGDEVSNVESRIGVSLDEEGGKILKTLGTHLPKKCSDTSLADRKQKNHSKKQKKRFNLQPGMVQTVVEPYGAGKPEGCSS